MSYLGYVSQMKYIVALGTIGSVMAPKQRLLRAVSIALVYVIDCCLGSIRRKLPVVLQTLV